ncbi:hypothetical protein D5F52_26790 (plasmid) [Brevibacillus laterosporus]|uniref:hypothetical protein n=1 Tax=Brevibacillus laterosporus TaxID=1465 RepID=UPI000E6CBA14|nr:hypothetical protein [Brevibacillus laterosporus]AYB41763.1 hypothetical protein D5F52_26790 [Brevibacillus laterosporus]
MSTILPSIVEIAQQNNLVFSKRQYSKKELALKCPFCHADENKKNKHYLSINVSKNVFKCFFCGIRGGVLRFESLLTDIPEKEIHDKYRTSVGHTKSMFHPVEQLTSHQIRQLGFLNKPNWGKLKKRDYRYYLDTRDWIWKEWLDYIHSKQYLAYQLLIIGIAIGKYQKVIGQITKIEKEIQTPLVDRVLEIYSQEKRPKWTIQAEKFASEILNAPSVSTTFVDKNTTDYKSLESLSIIGGRV